MEVTYTKKPSFEGVTYIDCLFNGDENVIQIVAYDAYDNERVIATFEDVSIFDDEPKITRIMNYYKKRYTGGKNVANNNTNGY